MRATGLHWGWVPPRGKEQGASVLLDILADEPLDLGRGHAAGRARHGLPAAGAVVIVHQVQDGRGNWKRCTSQNGTRRAGVGARARGHVGTCSGCLWHVVRTAKTLLKTKQNKKTSRAWASGHGSPWPGALSGSGFERVSERCVGSHHRPAARNQQAHPRLRDFRDLSCAAAPLPISRATKPSKNPPGQSKATGTTRWDWQPAQKLQGPQGAAST